MCGRYLPPDEAALERFWRIDRRNWDGWTRPRFNVAPTTIVPIIVEADDGAYELTGARWRIDPRLVEQGRAAVAHLQRPFRRGRAKADLAQQHPRDALPDAGPGLVRMERARTGTKRMGRKVNQPYFISSPDAEVIAFAGLWSLWQRPGMAPVLSCALLSKQAAPAISAIHHRMPVVLAPTQFAAWLDPKTSAETVQGLIAAAREDFAGYRVSTRVNNTRNDSPELLDPLPPGEPSRAKCPGNAGASAAAPGTRVSQPRSRVASRATPLRRGT